MADETLALGEKTAAAGGVAAVQADAPVLSPPQEKLSAGKAPPKWSEIVADEAFRDLPGEQKEHFRQAYRDKIVRPFITPQEWPAASKQFDEKTRSTTTDTALGHVAHKAWRGLARDSATMGPDLVDLIFLPKPGDTTKTREVNTEFGSTPGGAAVAQPTVTTTETPNPAVEQTAEIRDKFARYRKMVEKATGTDNEKAAPGPFSRFMGEAAEFMGISAPMSAMNVAKRPGAVGKTMQAGREVLSSTGAAGGMDLMKEFGEHFAPDSPGARALLMMVGGGLGGGLLEMALPTSAEFALNKAIDLKKRSAGMVDELVAQGMPVGKAQEAARLMVDEIAAFRKSSLGQELGKALKSQPSGAVAMQEAKDAAAKIPGFEPNLAMSTGSPSILQAGEHAARRNDYVAGAISSSQTSALKALNTYAEGMITSGKKTTKEVIDEITKSDLYKVTKELEANQKSWTELNERLTTGDFFTKADGEKLIELRAKAAANVQKSFNEQYKGLYEMADAAGFKMDMGEFYRDVLKIESAPGNIATKMPSTFALVKSRIGKMGDSEKKTAELGDLQERARTAPAGQAAVLQNRIRALRSEIANAEQQAAAVPATMEEVHSFNKAIAKDLRDATDPAAKHWIGEAQKRLDGRVKETNEGVHTALRGINDAYKKDYVEVFREGAAGRMVSETKFGNVTPEQEALRPYITRGTQGVEEFKKVFGNDPTAHVLVEQAMADRFAKFLMDKPVTPELVSRFVAQNKDFLAGFPEVGKKFASVERASEAFTKRADELAKVRDDVVSTQLKTLLNTTEPEKVLLQNVKSEEFMNRLHVMAKRSPEAAQAFAYDYGKIVQGMTPEQGAKFLTDHRKELKPIFDAFDPALYDKLSVLSVGKKVYERGWQDPASVAYGINATVDPFKRAIGSEIPTVLNRVFWAASGKTSNVWNTLYIGSKYFGQVQTGRWDHILGDAFTKPGFVDELLAAQYGPLLQEAQKQGKSVADLVAGAAVDPKTKESLMTVLSGMSKAGKDAFDRADLGHSLQAHGYRVIVGAADKGEESKERQTGLESKAPYWTRDVRSPFSAMLRSTQPSRTPP